MKLSSSTSSATRKSIKKYFAMGSMMSMTDDNPITLHDIDDKTMLFPAVWSFIAEVCEAEVGLNRLVIEKICLFVSTKNDCPICVNAHTILEEAAKVIVISNDKECRVSHQAVAYSEKLYLATTQDHPLPTVAECQKLYPDLTPANLAEIALVVLLFQYLNRAVSAILGEHMSRAMFSVPRPVAATLETDKGFWLYKKMMKPFLSKGLRVKPQPGITRSLFKDEIDDDFVLPLQLKDAELGGSERARAAARLYYLVDQLYETRLNKFVSRRVIQVLDSEDCRPPKGVTKSNAINWVAMEAPSILQRHFPDNKMSQYVAQILLMTDAAPSALAKCDAWLRVSKKIGKDNSRLLVCWWALRCAFVKQPKGLTNLSDKGDHVNTNENNTNETCSVESNSS